MAEQSHPALREQPSKLFVEVTTRCNLGCIMCVKQSCDHAIRDDDMAPATFATLAPAFSSLETLVLNGIGEPLLHPNLELFIALAKSRMPAHGWIGFQSNGLLLDEGRALGLLDAGLDRICLSIDSVSPETFRRVREGGELDDINDAFSALASAKRRIGRTDFRIGVEFVAMQSNIHELPDALTFAARRGASFALVTNLLPYDGSHAGEAVYSDCTDQGISLFNKWKAKAEQAGLDIYRYFDAAMKYQKSPEQRRLLALVEELKREAEQQGVLLDLKKLLRHDVAANEKVAAIFADAQQVAQQHGMELKLPTTLLKEQRSCGFVEDGGAFVAQNGDLSPCYFLWHRYRCFASGWEQKVKEKVFGNVMRQDVLSIWNSKAFRKFRKDVVAYDYPHCSSCTLAPCDYVQTEGFEQDCHIREVPCGACLWCTGIFHCLT